MTRRWQILVVDDEPVQRQSLAAWLAEDGYDAATAASGLDAIRAVGERDFDVAFIDL